MDTVFLSSVGAAAGSFIGVILFFLVRVYYEKWRTKPNLIRTYLCGNNRNQGQSTEAEGELMHHHGRRVVDSTELQKIGGNHPVWEWTKDPVGRNAGATIIYGPYATDFAKPGTYSAIFRIKATGLSHPDDISDDVVLLQLDVNKTISEYIPAGGQVSLLPAQYQSAIKYVRASDLAQQGWVDFELRFHSDAQGVWEYRAWANDGLDNKPDNIGRFGKDVRIFFDTVTVQEIKEIQVASV
jgi:hypothetical protein